MKSTIRKKWLKIYEMALRITEYQPWEDIAEFVPFTFLVPNAEELPFYTFFGGVDMLFFNTYSLLFPTNP